MTRDVNYLLDKYRTKQPGEEWKVETEVKTIVDYRKKQRMRLFDTINNQTFNVRGTQKDRAKYLIDKLDFKSMSNGSEEQIIVMIMIYTKMEIMDYQFYKFRHYLEPYNISLEMFINFLVNLNKYHAKKSYI